MSHHQVTKLSATVVMTLINVNGKTGPGIKQLIWDHYNERWILFFRSWIYKQHTSGLIHDHKIDGRTWNWVEKYSDEKLSKCHTISPQPHWPALSPLHQCSLIIFCLHSINMRPYLFIRLHVCLFNQNKYVVFQRCKTWRNFEHQRLLYSCCFS